MTRVKGGTIHRARRKKVLKLAKGYFGSKHRLYRTAKEQVMKSLTYSYRDRKQKKREFRKLWITRINAACREHGISYSRFINGLNKAGIAINRKMLSELAISDPQHFANLVETAKKALNNKEVESKQEEKKEIVKEDKKEQDNLSSLTVAELREIAKERNITGYSTMKKAELIDALK
ncbi:MAG: 50S ribosomal protein L20 [Mollicutes bacterium]|jgi:large subunit ribosomal protein L20|nr:50S ribosomal protein L20 [Mollicutes bacterium]